MLDTVDPAFVFYITSFLGLMIVLNGFLTNPELEAGDLKIVNMSLGARTKLTFREIWLGFKIKPLLRCAIFFFIYGGLVPRYTNYFYYYLTDELDFS